MLGNVSMILNLLNGKYYALQKAHSPLSGFCRQSNAARQYIRLMDLRNTNAKKDNIGDDADIVPVLPPRDATARAILFAEAAIYS
ncbi:hypothetical protein [Methylobacterium sp. WCS2018Hpa-22]|uniref:hypothetical protein n=1 Tax=Methylobacterium sp. WCS2018Hpa-22 TaxID=3073633 RepID=UPI00288BBBD8|nr:hypothetical protein [Methylobacterium sp. WCS2018Hpa-22]